jgi:membrane dipeptidase
VAAGIDKFPALLEELARRGWSDQELANVAGGNLLRVTAQAKRVSAKARVTRPPSNATIAVFDAPVAAPR